MTVAAVLVVLGSSVYWPTSRRVLTVCADPDRLPYSDRAGAGFENAVARLLADELDATVEYSWRPQRRGRWPEARAAGRCDVVMSAPLGSTRLLLTRPYYRSGYVFLSRTDAPHPVDGLDDPALARMSIGLQVAGGDDASGPSGAALADRGLSTNVRGYSFHRADGPSGAVAPVVEAVAAGEVDVALVWGPLAGYASARSPVPLCMTRAHGADVRETRALTSAIAIGVRPDEPHLRDELDAALARHQLQVAQILDAFAVPSFSSPEDSVEPRVSCPTRYASADTVTAPRPPRAELCSSPALAAYHGYTLPWRRHCTLTGGFARSEASVPNGG